MYLSCLVLFEKKYSDRNLKKSVNDIVNYEIENS